MSALDIVETVNVFEQGSSYFIAGQPFVSPDKFCLECFKESFNDACTSKRHVSITQRRDGGVTVG